MDCRQSWRSDQKVAQSMSILTGSLSNSFDKYSPVSAPFHAELMSNKVGWIAARMDDGLAISLLYSAKQGLLPD